jgi:hypothetical protein
VIVIKKSKNSGNRFREIPMEDLWCQILI